MNRNQKMSVGKSADGLFCIRVLWLCSACGDCSWSWELWAVSWELRAGSGLSRLRLYLSQRLRRSSLSRGHVCEREKLQSSIIPNPAQFTVQFVWEPSRKSLKVALCVDQMDRKWVSNRGTFRKTHLSTTTIRAGRQSLCLQLTQTPMAHFVLQSPSIYGHTRERDPIMYSHWIKVNS